VSLCLFLFFLKISVGDRGEGGLDFIFILIIFSIWFAGILTGLFLSVIFKKPNKEPLFYIVGQVAVVMAVFILFYFDFNKRHHDKVISNREYNHEYISSVLGYGTNAVERKSGFTGLNLLESNFKDPNMFRLDFVFMQQTDTLVYGRTDSIYNFIFSYKQVPGSARFSKIRIFNGNAQMEIFNADPAQSIEYTRMMKSAQQKINETTKALKEYKKPD
jgi:hypothetical protein